MIACTAVALFAQLAAASGGAAWNSIAEISAAGRLTSSGLRGEAELDSDLRSGRYAMRFSLPVEGASAEVYDGRTVWSRDISGGVHPYDSWYPRARAITESFLTRRQYLDPRAGVAANCIPVAKAASGRDDLVRIVPRGGIPAVLAIDPRSHLLDSVSIRTPISTDVTTYGDYRQVDRIVLPFTISAASLFEPENGTRIQITHYRLARDVRSADFDRPHADQRARMRRNVRSTTVPIVLEGRQLFVWASINGRAPMPFILDTGGHAILDTVAAKRLGLQGAGGGVSGGSGSGTVALQYTRVRSVRIGDAELLDQPFLVIPYSYSFYERGRKEPLAGILGLEWFERYAARIDYSERKLTLTPLSGFKHRATGRNVRIVFQEDMPLAHAAADGQGGDFGVDTGNAGTLILYGDFLRRTGLLARYTAGIAIRGEGTGGSNTGRLEKLRSFAIGGAQIGNLNADFTQMKTGSFSSWTEAGDLGLSVLSRFVPTFDYAQQRLYLDPVTKPYVVAPNRSGISFTKNRVDAIEIVAVRPNSSASQLGLAAGDRIVQVNGKAADQLSAADFLELVTSSAGVALQLVIRRGDNTRNVRLVLR